MKKMENMTVLELLRLRARLRAELQEELAVMRANLRSCEIRSADESRPFAAWIARLRAKNLRKMLTGLESRLG
jgi:hypothetical protein